MVLEKCPGGVGGGLFEGASFKRCTIIIVLAPIPKMMQTRCIDGWLFYVFDIGMVQVRYS